MKKTLTQLWKHIEIVALAKCKSDRQTCTYIYGYGRRQQIKKKEKSEKNKKIQKSGIRKNYIKQKIIVRLTDPRSPEEFWARENIFWIYFAKK